jgi:hypothetical protein
MLCNLIDRYQRFQKVARNLEFVALLIDTALLVSFHVHCAYVGSLPTSEQFAHERSRSVWRSGLGSMGDMRACTKSALVINAGCRTQQRTEFEINMAESKQ